MKLNYQNRQENLTKSLSSKYFNTDYRITTYVFIRNAAAATQSLYKYKSGTKIIIRQKMWYDNVGKLNNVAGNSVETSRNWQTLTYSEWVRERETEIRDDVMTDMRSVCLNLVPPTGLFTCMIHIFINLLTTSKIIVITSAY